MSSSKEPLRGCTTEESRDVAVRAFLHQTGLSGVMKGLLGLPRITLQKCGSGPAAPWAI